MYTRRVIVGVLFSGALWAQSGAFSLSGEIKSESGEGLNGYYVELLNQQEHVLADRTSIGSDGHFRFQSVNSGTYTVRVVSSPGADPVLEEYRQLDPMSSPLLLELRGNRKEQPTGGIVSVRELAHPVPKKALKAFAESLRYEAKNDFQRATEKLEQAIQIAPDFRNARVNLGALYARAKRLPEALAQFQEALNIGPADSAAFANLGWAYLSLRNIGEAELAARKAVQLDSHNTKAQLLLGYALASQGGKDAEALTHLRSAPDHPDALILSEKLQQRMGARVRMLE